MSVRKRHRDLLNSLSGRLTLLYIGTSVILLILIAISIGSAFRSHFADTVKPHLFQYIQYVQQDLGMPPRLDRAQDLSEKLGVVIAFIASNGQWSTDGKTVDLQEIDAHHWRQFNNIEYAFGFSKNKEYLVAKYPDYTLVFSEKRVRNELVWRWIPIALVALLLLILFHLTKKLISPVHTIREGISRIGSGELNHRIQVNRKDELGVLANSINTMAEDLEQLLEAKRQLLLAISHELRSPITRAKVAAELLNEEKPRQEIQKDLDEMEKLIEELLETERLANRHQSLNYSRISLQDLIHQLVQDHFSSAQLKLDLPSEEVEMLGDNARIKLLLKNVLDNALKHTPDSATPPVVTLSESDKSITIQVKDFGAGIGAEHLAHLTEPFYRVDKSRQRDTGGYGLGLYLCRMIVEAHGGVLSIESEPGKGTVVSTCFNKP
ncbi:MAG: HAMP domain-containing histidine kinase [Gammaproteobacteria bacterium]|nr:HAMP domain-containing histidine kinase [Gammaproteobacteria bacterium]MDH5692644.1 HAMP domain-containing histidine kinase [Gammaproteobacteria bacterium]